MNGLTFDYIIIGAGASGCVVAGRLAEDSTAGVALVEAGGGDDSLYLKIPALSFMVMSKDEYNWNFATEPVPGFDGRTLNILSGKVVGGGSSVNGLIYSRGFSREYDYWRQLGCEGWGFDDVLPYFKRSEGSDRGGSNFHGADGPLKVKKGGSDLPIYKSFLRAVSDAGFPIVDDLVSDVEGFGYYDTNVSADGRRVSAATAFLGRGRERGNLELLTKATALRVVIEKGRAEGVEILHQGEHKLLRARKEVILSAGAIKTPQLLMLSGVGPSAELAKHNVPVLVHSPNVGANYQNHVPYTLQYLCSRPVSAFSYLKPVNAIKAGLTYLTARRGPLAETAFGVGGTFKTDQRLEVPDIQVVVSGAIVFGAGTANAELKREKTFRDHLPTAEGFAVMVYQGSPQSRGTVGLRSKDPLDQPLICPNHLSDPRDMKTLTKAVKQMREAMEQPAIRSVIAREVSPGDAVQSDEALEAEIRKNGGTVSHHCGTCAIGSADASVVDPQLRVRGVKDLRVADNSIIPVILNATLHSHALMIGERAADFVRGRS